MKIKFSRGRPKFPNGIAKGHIIQVRVSDKEFIYINEYCKKEEITVSEFLRERIEKVIDFNEYNN